jgi:hypothetical protein
MNERIKELIQQVQVNEQIAHLAKQTGCTIDRLGYGEGNLEKFAELIVLEMCQVMKAEGEQFSLDQNFDAVKGVGRCMRKVKQHFGVEE